MSVAERIQSIISEARKEHEEKLRAQQREIEHLAAALSKESKAGAAWLQAHVLPALTTLRQALAPEGVVVEIQEHLTPRPGVPVHHFNGPTISLRLVAAKSSETPGRKLSSYTFHCDGRFISIARQTATGIAALGMPFDIDSNPSDADEIVLTIIRRAIEELYAEIREE